MDPPNGSGSMNPGKCYDNKMTSQQDNNGGGGKTRVDELRSFDGRN